MNKQKPPPGAEAASSLQYQQAADAADEHTSYSLRLYVTGLRPKSQHAISNLRRLCEEYLKGRYELEIIDIYQQPQLASSEQIVAAPTLIKLLPLPLRKLLGDMSDESKVLLAMDVKDKDG